MTNRFKLSYRNGNTEEVITDADTIEAQAMRSFGMTLEEAREFGTDVELLGPFEPPAPEAPAEAPAPAFEPADLGTGAAGETSDTTTAFATIEGHAPTIEQAPAEAPAPEAPAAAPEAPAEAPAAEAPAAATEEPAA